MKLNALKVIATILLCATLVSGQTMPTSAQLQAARDQIHSLLGGDRVDTPKSASLPAGAHEQLRILDSQIVSFEPGKLKVFQKNVKDSMDALHKMSFQGADAAKMAVLDQRVANLLK